MAGIPNGKGVYIWQLDACGFGENMRALVDDLVYAGVEWVSVKIQDGASLTWDTSHVALLHSFIAWAKGRGLDVRGWGYLYGGSAAKAVKEGQVSVLAINEYGVSGFEIDAEQEYKAPGSKTWAIAYMNTLRGAKPMLSVSLSSYRFPNLHNEFPWAEFLAQCDLHLPQVYWIGAHNPAGQLVQSVGQLKARRDLPVVPVGAGFPFGDWEPTVADWLAFDEEAKALGCPGLSVWSLQHVRQLPEVWQCFQGLDWGAEPPPPSDPGPLMFEVVADSLFIRSGPGQSYPVVGGLEKGQVVECENVGGWNAWVEILPGKWACVSLSGVEYMRKVQGA